jgi:hypothetical protein
MERLVLLACIVCWMPPADAFFCFTFSGHSSDRARFQRYPMPYYPIPPPYLYAATVATPQTERERDLPPIKARAGRAMPELIGGYRFRPLARGEHQISPSPPVTDSPH